MSTVDLHQPAIPITYARLLVDLCARWHVATEELVAGTALFTLMFVLTSLSDDELSPAGLAARVVLQSVMRELVQQGRWPGATLHES